MITYTITYFGAILVAMLLVPVVSQWAKKHDLVDEPGPRKVHRAPIPRVGGIVFVVATLSFVVPIFFVDNHIGQSFRESRTQLIVLLASAVFVFVMGLMDDLRPLPGSFKLACLLGASLAVCVSGATIRSVSVGPWFSLDFGWAAWPLTILWITTITAGMNFIDGLDGLAAGIAAIVLGVVAFVAYVTGQAAMAVLMLALLGSVTGFLFFNFYPAKIFMGDCGSMFLGFMIGAGSLACRAKTSTMVGLMLPFLVLGVPIFDAALTMIRRSVLYRRSIFSSEWGHLHHRLLDLGLPQRTVAMVMYAITAICAGIGVLMLTVSAGWSLGLFVVGVIFLLSVFVCLGAVRVSETVAAANRIWAILRDGRADRRCFEDAQLRMREATCFDLWWDTLCKMSERLSFLSIELRRCSDGHCASTRIWNSTKRQWWTQKTATFVLPLRGGATATDWEIEASVSVNGRLESSSRQAMLLSRLVDEFPPPDEDTEAQEKGTSLSLEERRSGPVAGEGEKTRESPEFAPAPLDITGVPVVPFESYDEALQCIGGTISARHKSFWVAINPQKCYRAWHERKLFDVLNRADVGICDGVGVSIASRLLHGRGIHRITGCDLFFKLVALAEKEGWGIFMLGASEESNFGARSRLLARHPNLRIVGSQNGFFDDSKSVIEQINSSRADLLFVAMGSPAQEYWISRYRDEIDAPFCMGVGGTFDVASGTIKRAPAIFRKTGTEWLYQLVTEPQKRFKRQTVYVPFMLRIFGINVFGGVMDAEQDKYPIIRART